MNHLDTQSVFVASELVLDTQRECTIAANVIVIIMGCRGVVDQFQFVADCAGQVQCDVWTTIWSGHRPFALTVHTFQCDEI